METLKKIANELVSGKVAGIAKENVNIINNLQITKVRATEKETKDGENTYLRNSFTFNKPIKAFRVDEETGEFVNTESTFGFFMQSDIERLLSDNPATMFVADFVRANPNALKVILSGAKVSVCQIKVIENEEYKNPWYENSEPIVVSNNSYYNQIIDLELSAEGQQWVRMLGMQLLFGGTQQSVPMI